MLGDPQNEGGFAHQVRELVRYMKLLRRQGLESDNRILRRLAQPQKIEQFVEFLIDATYRGGTEIVDTIVVSDLHLGSKHSQAAALRTALRRFTFNRLILNGDIFDHLKLQIDGTGATGQPLQPAHRELFEEIRALSHTHEVVWIRGNHDDGLSGFLGDALSVRVYEEYQWEYRGKRYLALHGDQFDFFYRDHPVLYWLGTQIYTKLQRIGPSTMSLCKFLKRKTKWYTNAMTSTIEGALAHGKARQADVVLCGHTHAALEAQGPGVGYYNSGGWTESVCHLIAVSERGVRIHAFDTEGKHLGLLSPAL